MIDNVRAGLDQTLPLWEANNCFTSYLLLCTSFRDLLFSASFSMVIVSRWCYCVRCSETHLALRIARTEPYWKILPPTLKTGSFYNNLFNNKIPVCKQQKIFRMKKKFKKKIPDLCVLVNVTPSSYSAYLFHSIR